MIVARYEVYPAITVSAKLGTAQSKLTTEVRGRKVVNEGSAPVTGLGLEYRPLECCSITLAHENYLDFAGSGKRVGTVSLGARIYFH